MVSSFGFGVSWFRHLVSARGEGGRVRGDTPFCVDGGGGKIRALTEIWSFPAYVLQAQFVIKHGGGPRI